jgi:hypothetical protein
MAAEGEAEGEGIVICPHCLAEGDIDAKLERHAARLESKSRWLRALIGRLESVHARLEKNPLQIGHI